MSMHLTLTSSPASSPASASISIGDDSTSDNTIKLLITLEGDEAVWLTLQIPVGEDGVLAKPEDANNIEITATDQNGKTVAVNSRQPESQLGSATAIREWSLGDLDKGLSVTGCLQITVTISKVLCRSSVNQSEITILGQTNSDNKITQNLQINKTKQPKGNPILYFTATPECLIGKGDVTLRWDLASNVSDIKLVTPQHTDGYSRTESTAKVSVDRTYTFQLEVNNTSFKRSASINVYESGWHEIPTFDDTLFPSVIFRPAKSDDKYLYVIFLSRSSAKPALYRSPDGISAWEKVSCDIPKGMESSPGVRLGDRLWLIGGSAADPQIRSNEIWFYDLKGSKLWQAATTHATPAYATFEPRMGHSCVAVDTKTIWVMGGIGESLPLNDVWKLTIGEDPLQVTIEILTGLDEQSFGSASTPWSPRCMFSTVKFNNQIWVCGGVSEPYGKPLGDIWVCSFDTDPKAWKKRPQGVDYQYPIANAIGTGADSSDDHLYAVVVKRTGAAASTTQTCTYSLRSDAIHPASETWTDLGGSPTLEAPEPLSIAMVSFQKRLYLRCLTADSLDKPGTTPSLFFYVSKVN